VFRIGFKKKRPGDLGYIITGGQVPIVLRSIDSPSGERGPFWIVGEAYIHGMMAGEEVAKVGFQLVDLLIR
jgi:hypothetical protein